MEHFHLILFEFSTKIPVPSIWIHAVGVEEKKKEEKLYAYGIHKAANKYTLKLLVKEIVCIDCSDVLSI